MEIEGQDGSKTLLKKGFKRELGRGLGFNSNDRTISRRHVVFELQKDESQTDPNSEYRVCFEVTGNNPIWVRNRENGEIRVFRRSERGEMEGGDMFCVSAKKPVWFTLKRTEFEAEDESAMKKELGNVNELAECLQSSYGLRGADDLELDSVDVSSIDPIKEFGFLVMGHEFDNYPKQMIRDAKSWDWFLEESKGDSEDDDNKRKKSARGKRKKARGGDDDDWTGESEDDTESITKIRKVRRPKYSTRSKHHDKYIKDARIIKHAVAKKPDTGNEDDEEDEDDDEDTLGGFIVNDDDIDQVEEEESGEEEEESDDDEDE